MKVNFVVQMYRHGLLHSMIRYSHCTGFKSIVNIIVAIIIIIIVIIVLPYHCGYSNPFIVSLSMYILCVNCFIFLSSSSVFSLILNSLYTSLIFSLYLFFCFVHTYFLCPSASVPFSFMHRFPIHLHRDNTFFLTFVSVCVCVHFLCCCFTPTLPLR